MGERERGRERVREREIDSLCYAFLLNCVIPTIRSLVLGNLTKLAGLRKLRKDI